MQGRRRNSEIRKRLSGKLLNINATESVQVSGLEKYLPSMEVEKGKGERVIRSQDVQQAHMSKKEHHSQQKALLNQNPNQFVAEKEI